MMWSYCVEMTVRGDPVVRWIVMHGRRYDGGPPLTNITKEEAIERASKLPRTRGEFAYRVRRFCPVSG